MTEHTCETCPAWWEIDQKLLQSHGYPPRARAGRCKRFPSLVGGEVWKDQGDYCLEHPQLRHLMEPAGAHIHTVRLMDPGVEVALPQGLEPKP